MGRPKKTKQEPAQTPVIAEAVEQQIEAEPIVQPKKQIKIKPLELKKPIGAREVLAPPVPQKTLITKDQKAVEYKITFNDGTVMYAEGRHAEVFFRYVAACEFDAATYGRFRYDGPAMELYSKSEWEKKRADKKD